MPNPTNEIVAPFYGIGPLWKTEYSQGVVVKAEDDDDYYIVMECSSKNKGYKHTKVILTMGGAYKNLNYWNQLIFEIEETSINE